MYENIGKYFYSCKKQGFTKSLFDKGLAVGKVALFSNVIVRHFLLLVSYSFFCLRLTNNSILVFKII